MASKANEKRIAVTLECTECKRRNYITEKNKVNDRERIEMKKYCRSARRRAVHHVALPHHRELRLHPPRAPGEAPPRRARRRRSFRRSRPRPRSAGAVRGQCHPRSPDRRLAGAAAAAAGGGRVARRLRP